ncbi:hypothetical protein CYFUS_005905 [Cystobacter fuscus]|uniref:Uncharacterized protein n=1 Tax=Cystobacter fuscus TaxID=43 RepID=A0A250JBA3_9BACT|nr:hypothetical protein [Cystobacter fuscus]ATB40456.1 hypothetical protein CYFUS_005905 [Cystobacter fuscus]
MQMCEKRIPRRRTFPATTTTPSQSPTIGLTVLLLLLADCSRGGSPAPHGESRDGSTQVNTPPIPAPESETTREVRLKLLVAYLEDREPIPFEMNCLGAEPGEAEPTCDLRLGTRFNGFLESLRGAIGLILQVKKIQEIAPVIYLDLSITAVGWADGLPWQDDMKLNEARYATYLALASRYGHPVLKNLPENRNSILATTRAMHLLNGARRHIERLLAENPRASEIVVLHWTVIPRETERVGPQYRGATLSATLRIGLSNSANRTPMVNLLERSGWRVREEEK